VPEREFSSVSPPVQDFTRVADQDAQRRHIVRRRRPTDAMSSAPTYRAAPAVPIRGLHHFAYRCRDCEETRCFYEDLLGLPLVHAVKAEDPPRGAETCPCVQMFFAMGDGCCIAFFDLGDGDTAPRTPDRRRWANHLALRADSLDALHAVKARLAAAGVDVLGPIDRGTIQSIYFFDPNGIRLELTTPTAADAEVGELSAQARHQVERWMTRKRAVGRAAGRPETGCPDGSQRKHRSSEREVTMGSPSPELSNLWLARAFNAHDVDAAAALYHPEASVVQVDDVHGGTSMARGPEAIRKTMAAYIGLKPHMDVVTHHTTVAGDFAMTRSQWLIRGTDEHGKPTEVHHHGMEVHRRLPDGTWVYFIDHPFGADSSWAVEAPPHTE
jgi:catechol 2,3-dioxygenase-like lactoylglutathione lyase family enzyme/ketosteroid isomerase-like protein